MSSSGQDREKEWISPWEALSLLTKSPAEIPAMKIRLADLLKDGLVEARAQRLWVSNDPNLNLAWDNREDADAETDLDVEPSVWRSSRYWNDDLSLWRWQENRFVVTRRRRPADRTIIEGLSLKRADLQKLRGTRKASAARRPGGRPPKMDEWHAFWLEVIDLAQSRRLNRGEFASGAALKEELLLRITPKYSDKPMLSGDSIEGQVSAIWKRFVETT
jgi:hypothetical protein